MASEILTASLRHEYSEAGKRQSDLIDANAGGRLAGVRWSHACNVGCDRASARVLGLDGSDLIPEGEAAAILYWWRFAVLEIRMAGEWAWEGRVWGIQLGPLVDDPHLGQARTVSITAKGLAYDLGRLPARVPVAFTEEGATTTVSDLIEAAIDDQGGIIAHHFEGVGSTAVDAGQIGAALGDYWLDMIIRGLQTGDSHGIEWTFLVYEPEAGPYLVPRGQGPVRWRYPAVGAGVGVAWDGSQYASDLIVNATDAAHSAESVFVDHDEEALALHHGIPSGRAINVDGTSGAGAEAAGRTYLALHGNPVAPSDRLVIEPKDAPYAQLEGPEGALEPGWRVRAGQVLDLQGLLPSDNRWRHMRKHNIEGTEYDDESGTLSITLDQRRLRSRVGENAVAIRQQWAALAPSRPRGLDKTFEVDPLLDAYVVTDDAAIVTTIGVDGQCTFTLTTDTTVTITFFAVIVPLAFVGRLTLGIDVDGEGFDDTDHVRMARDRIEVADTEPRTLEGTYDKTLSAGEHMIRLWAECQAALAGSTLTVGRIRVQG